MTPSPFDDQSALFFEIERLFCERAAELDALGLPAQRASAAIEILSTPFDDQGHPLNRDEDESEDAPRPSDPDEINADFRLGVLALVALAQNQESLARMLSACPDLPRLALGPARRTLLISAAMEGALWACQNLLPHSDPNQQDRLQDSALSLAAAMGCVDIVELLAPLTDPNLLDHEGWGPLELALGGDGEDAFHLAQAGRPPCGPRFLRFDQAPPPGWSRRDRLACHQALLPLSPRRVQRSARDGAPWTTVAIEKDRHDLLAFLLRESPQAAPELAALLACAIETNAIECARLLIPLAPLSMPLPPRPWVEETPDSLPEGIRPLDMAAALGRIVICRELLSANPKLANLPGPEGIPLAGAAARGRLGCVELLAPFSSLGASALSGKSPLESALEHGQLACAQAIWRHAGENPKLLSPLTLHFALESRDDCAEWALLAFDPQDIAPMLGARAASVLDGFDPLEGAIDRKRWKCAGLILRLLQAGSSPPTLMSMNLAIKRRAPPRLAKALARSFSPWILHPLDEDGNDAFEKACERPFPLMARLILRHALASPEIPQGWIAKALAACFDSWSCAHGVKKLLPRLAQRLSQPELDELLAKHCAKKSPTLLHQTLLDAGADPRATFAGQSACLRAAVADHSELVELLIERGADPLAAPPSPDPRQPSPASALGWACARASRATFRALLGQKPSPQLAASCLALFDPAHPWAAARVLELLPFLDPDAPWELDSIGRCAFMRAARQANCRLIELLAPLAPKGRVDRFGLTPLIAFMRAEWEPGDEPRKALAALALTDPDSFELAPDQEAVLRMESPKKFALFEPLATHIRETRQLSQSCAAPSAAKPSSLRL